MPQHVEAVNLDEHNRGLEQMIKAVTEAQREMPLDFVTRVTVNIESLAGTFTYLDLAVMLGLAIDRLAVQDIVNPSEEFVPEEGEN